MSIHSKLMEIQNKLKAPKNQYNSFGKYKYRSCEDILEGVKPLLKETGCTLILSDEVIAVADRIYIKATATLTDAETNESVSNSAMARESLDKKGMDDSQITGTASSYARKYALNGMFCIDDTKDADTDEYTASNNRQNSKSKPATLDEKSREVLNSTIAKYVSITGSNINDVMKQLGSVIGKKPKDYTSEDAKKALDILTELISVSEKGAS